MAETIEISDEAEAELARAATVRGETKAEIIERALQRYLHGAANGPEITDPAEVAAIRAEAAGMWKDRTDLPDVRDLRAGWERRLSRMFGDDE